MNGAERHPLTITYLAEFIGTPFMMSTAIEFLQAQVLAADSVLGDALNADDLSDCLDRIEEALTILGQPVSIVP